MRSVFKSSIWENRPSPWELLNFEPGNFELGVWEIRSSHESYEELTRLAETRLAQNGTICQNVCNICIYRIMILIIIMMIIIILIIMIMMILILLIIYTW